MFGGRNQLINRLTWQLGGNREKAIQILRKRGHMKQSSEELTKAGMARDAMTAREREADRGEKPGSSDRQYASGFIDTRKMLKKKR